MIRVLPPDAAGIAEAITVLRNGGTVAHATETCYGFACDLGNPKAVARLFVVKHRPETQPVSALFSSLDQAKKYLEWNDRAEELAREFLPGPLTIILPMRSDAPTTLYMRANRTHLPMPSTNQKPETNKPTNPNNPTTQQPNNPTVGLRLSPHPVARALAEGFGAPISTTSANIHGQPSPYSAEEILAQYENSDEKPDLILDSGTSERRLPSRIVDLSGSSESILRP